MNQRPKLEFSPHDLKVQLYNPFVINLKNIDHEKMLPKVLIEGSAHQWKKMSSGDYQIHLSFNRAGQQQLFVSWPGEKQSEGIIITVLEHQALTFTQELSFLGIPIFCILALLIYRIQIKKSNAKRKNYGL